MEDSSDINKCSGLKLAVKDAHGNIYFKNTVQ